MFRDFVDRRDVGFLVLVGAVLAAFQFSFEPLVDSDGFLHVRLAERVLEGGMPWMPLSIFADRWVDHQLLFHLAMFPFATILPGILAAKTFAVLLGAVAAWGAYRFLRGQGTPAPAFFAVLPWAVSWLFAVRLAMPRPQGMSLLLLALFTGALIGEKRGRVALIAGTYALTYHVAIITVPLAAAFAQLVFFRDGRAAARRPVHCAIATALGFAGGMTLHPHSPDTWTFLWQHVFVKVANEQALPVGREWSDGGISMLLRHGTAVLLAVAAIVGLATRRRLSTPTIFLAGASLAATLALLSGSKYLEYALPLGAWAAALAGRDLAILPGRSVRRLIVALAGAGVFASLTIARSAIQAEEPPPDRLRPLGAALRTFAAPSDIVYHFSWNDLPELVFWAPDQRYIVGLDPHFLALADEELWSLHARIARGVRNPSEPIRERFGARWAALVLPYPGAEQVLGADPGLVRRWSDDHAVLYEVLPASAGPGLPTGPGTAGSTAPGP